MLDGNADQHEKGKVDRVHSFEIGAHIPAYYSS